MPCAAAWCTGPEDYDQQAESSASGQEYEPLGAGRCAVSRHGKVGYRRGNDMGRSAVDLQEEEEEEGKWQVVVIVAAIACRRGEREVARQEA